MESIDVTVKKIWLNDEDREAVTMIMFLMCEFAISKIWEAKMGEPTKIAESYTI